MISTSYLPKTGTFTMTATSSSTTTSTNNSKFYNSVNTEKFSIKNLPESMSPLSVSNITFSNISEDIGPIPPPRMFSDAVICALQAVDAENKCTDYSDQVEIHEVKYDTQVNENINGMDSSLNVDPLINQMSNITMNNYSNGDSYFYDDYYGNFDYDEWSSPFVEEVPAKEPKLSAVPKKSALKKPKHFTNYNTNQATNGLPEYRTPYTNLANGYASFIFSKIFFYYFCKLFCLFRSVMSKIRHFNSNAVNNISNNSNEAKLHVAKLHMMPSITLTNPDMKSTTITENKNTSGDSSTNLKDYYGDDEKGLL